MHVFNIVIFAIWIVFWAYWLISATGAKRGRNRWRSFVITRVGFVVILVVLGRLGAFSGNGFAINVRNPVLQGVGLVLLLLGLGLAVWARLYLGKNWGMPMTQKADPELVRTGPYRYVRHPIYSGMLLGMAGTGVAVSTFWFIILILMGAYFTFSAFTEERNMAKTFPDTYPDYKHSTKMLVPFVL